MLKRCLLQTILVCLSAILLLSSCSSGDSKDKDDLRKKRDEEEQTSSTKKRGTLPPLQSSTVSSSPQNTTPVNSQPFLTSDQISTTWTSQTLCSLISPSEVKTIIKMSTQPNPEYSFSKQSGARCTFRSAGGDELYYEISISTFDELRKIDKALMAEGESIMVKGVGGVVKTNKAFGTTYELNVSGGSSNQLTANAPSESQAKALAEKLVTNLKSRN